MGGLSGSAGAPKPGTPAPGAPTSGASAEPQWWRGMPRGVVRSDAGWRSECLFATSFARRLRGLAGVPAAEVTGVLVFPECRSVHTFTMAYPIDVLLLDASGRVLRSRRGVPRCMIVEDPAACAAVERPAREAPWPDEGDTLRFVRDDGRGALCSAAFA